MPLSSSMILNPASSAERLSFPAFQPSALTLISFLSFTLESLKWAVGPSGRWHINIASWGTGSRYYNDENTMYQLFFSSAGWVVFVTMGWVLGDILCSRTALKRCHSLPWYLLAISLLCIDLCIYASVKSNKTKTYSQQFVSPSYWPLAPNHSAE